MSMFEYIDIYCERQSPDFLAEPLNLVSNVAFLIAATYALHSARTSRGSASFSVRWLCVVLFLVGIGSGLFHSFATRWAMLSDTTPIQVFILSFFFLWLHRVLRLGTAVSMIGMFLLFFGSAGLAYVLRDLPLNGSQGYVGTLLALFALGLHDLRRRKERILLIAAFLFLVSICARSMDESLCNVIPSGTHFVWHLLKRLCLLLGDILFFCG